MASINGNNGVIFDLDGVLIDSGWAHKQSWYDLAEKEGYQMSDEFFYNTFGMQNYQILPLLAGKALSVEEIDRLSDWKEQRYRDIFSESMELSAGAERLLNELKSEGFLLAIGSSTPKINIDFVMEKLDLEKYFNAVVSKQDVARGKPAPDTFLAAAKNLSLKPENCVVIEDSIPGIEAAKAASMAVIAITTTRDRSQLPAADIIVDSLDELRSDDFVKILRAKSNCD
ncbi:MAG: HAD family phosphatase [Sedimentisphaerales bacterium]|nr:HAD family phosphatase [Sedimentisphaerales bacterium]